MNPNYKSGIKRLNEEQLKSGLLNYNVLEDKIEKIRNESKKVNLNLLYDEPFEALKYDQIFSILGGRGAGKTSVLLTLYDKYKFCNDNIVLPIIMPELIEPDENIVSWLLSAMAVNLSEIEKKIKDVGLHNESLEYSNVCEYYKLFERCVFNKNNKLRSKFEKLKNAYYTKEISIRERDHTVVRELKAQSNENSFSLIKMFIDYWNALVDIYSSYLKEIDPESKDHSPLIFIFIDDADLKPQIINELVFVVPKYLSHPNVVVFVSASQKTFTYAIKNHMYKELTQTTFDLPALMNEEYNYNSKSYMNSEEKRVRFHDLRYGKEYDKIQKLSNEILRKLFPVYNRFYLRKYIKYEEKGLLRMFRNNNSDCEDTSTLTEKFSEILFNFFVETIELHKKIKIKFTSLKEPKENTIKKKIKNFYVFKFEEVQDLVGFNKEFTNSCDFADKLNKSYLNFFGKYPRDMVSVYYALEELLEDMLRALSNLYCSKYKTDKSEQENISDIPLNFIQDIYEYLIKFIESAVSSNRNLAMFSKCTRDLVKTQLLNWQLYVDYSKILEVMRNKNYADYNKNSPDSFVEMIVLMNFVEQLIMLLIPQRQKSHGYVEFTEILDFCGINIIKRSDSLENMLKQYYEFHELNLIPNFDISRVEHQNNFLRGIDALNLINDKEEGYDISLDIIQNDDWYSLLAKTYFLRLSPSSKFIDFKRNLLVLRENEFVGDEYRELSELYEKKIKKYFDEEKIEVNDRLEENNEQKVRNVALNMVKLDSIIENLELVIEEGILQQLHDISNKINFSNNVSVAKEVTQLMSSLKYGDTIRRSYILSKLKTIDWLVEHETEDYFFLKDWFNEFHAFLRKNLKRRIPTSDQKDDYLDIINQIKREYDAYIKFYVSKAIEKSSNSNKSISLSFISNAEFKNAIEYKLSVVKSQEWYRFVGKEK